MRTILRFAVPMLPLLAACPGGTGACLDPNSACEVVDGDLCSEHLLCPGTSASENGGAPYISGGLYVAGLRQEPGRQRASVTVHLSRVPAVGETIVWTPEDTGDFELVIVERYGDSRTFPLPVTHAAGEARDASPTGPARPAQGTVRVHLDAIGEWGALSGWVEAECPPVGDAGAPVTVRLSFENVL